MQFVDNRFTFNGPIFDSHTHIIGRDLVDIFVRISDNYGISKTLAIIHDHPDRAFAEEKYPNRFIFAKYFSGTSLRTESPNEIVREVEKMDEEDYPVAKAHFAPFWIHRSSETSEEGGIDSPRFDVFFDAVSDARVPTILHVSDPDTYYARRYSDTELYGTKEDHISQFERRLERNRDVAIQGAHFAAQPEAHRLSNLQKMLEQYPNLHVDTSSARWMARELGRDPEKSKQFFIDNADRIVFATDCVTRTDDASYYEGRHLALRLMLESDVKHEPLPFPDPDTSQSGGTFINGLSLPDKVLEKIYWENAQRIFGF